MRFWPGCCCPPTTCTMDLIFRYSNAFTNVNGDGEATITVSPAIEGVTTFLVVPVHHPATAIAREYWELTIADVHVPDGSYTFSMSRTGTGTETFPKAVEDCVAYHEAVCQSCGRLPDEVYLTDVGTPDPSGHMRTTTLTYGELGPDYWPYTTGAGYGPGWRSEELIHPTHGYRYKLILYCNLISGNDADLWYVHNFVVPQLHVTGNPYTWDADDPENTCEPLSWTVGSRPGAPPGDTVKFTIT